MTDELFRLFEDGPLKSVFNMMLDYNVEYVFPMVI